TCPRSPINGESRHGLLLTSNGYISNVKLYTGLHLLTQLYHNITLFVGKTPGVTEKGLGHKVATELVSDYRDKGYYSSSKLFNDLVKSGFCACRTVRSDRRGIKQTFKDKVLSILSHRYIKSLVIITAKITTFYKAMKWWKNIFYHLLDLSLVNANILHNEASQKPLHQMDFCLAVAKSLLQSHESQSLYFLSVDNVLPLRLTSTCFSERIPKTSQYAGCHQCVVCGARKKQSQTRYRCKTCQVAIHNED
uniref:PiggyBac transposable element-derived protein domain-containing protein n=1 Tax=Amphimedon queenslandica TaxID=400682 RepID=A0A1X7UWM2_AMPQE